MIEKLINFFKNGFLSGLTPTDPISPKDVEQQIFNIVIGTTFTNGRRNAAIPCPSNSQLTIIPYSAEFKSPIGMWINVPVENLEPRVLVRHYKLPDIKLFIDLYCDLEKAYCCWENDLQYVQNLRQIAKKYSLSDKIIDNTLLNGWYYFNPTKTIDNTIISYYENIPNISVIGYVGEIVPENISNMKNVKVYSNEDIDDNIEDIKDFICRNQKIVTKYLDMGINIIVIHDYTFDESYYNNKIIWAKTPEQLEQMIEG